MTLKDTLKTQNFDPDDMHGDSPFRNRLLVATPSMGDQFFERCVVYICAHSAAGAMGIIINQKIPDIVFSDLLNQLNMPQSTLIVDPIVHLGGPVDTTRGFVLHSEDYFREDTVRITDTVCMTGTVDILQDIADGKGPSKSIFALGYAGWSAGQLEQEIHENAWLCLPAEENLIFDTSLAEKWEKTLLHMGVDPLKLSPQSGHA